MWKLFLVLMLCLLVSCNAYQKGKVCGTHVEKYIEKTDGCDKLENCRCINEQLLGFGECDDCECTKNVSNC